MKNGALNPRRALLIFSVVLLQTVGQAQILKVDSFPTTVESNLDFQSSSKGVVIGLGSAGSWSLYTSDSCRTWASFGFHSILPNAGRPKSLIVQESGTGWCVGEQIAVNTTDYGLTWRAVDTVGADSIKRMLLTAELYDVEMVGDSLIWISGYFDNILFSSNGGGDWSALPFSIEQFKRAVSLQFVSPTHGFALTTDFAFCETTDGGVSWQQRTYSPRILFYELKMVNDTLGWANDGNRLLQTKDAGRNWKAVFTVPRFCDFVLTSFGEDRVWCATGVQACHPGRTWVYFSKNGGKSWDSLSSTENSNGFRHIFATDSVTAYALGFNDLYVVHTGLRDTATSVISDVTRMVSELSVSSISDIENLPELVEANEVVVTDIIGRVIYRSDIANRKADGLNRTATSQQGVYFLLLRYSQYVRTLRILLVP